MSVSIRGKRHATFSENRTPKGAVVLFRVVKATPRSYNAIFHRFSAESGLPLRDVCNQECRERATSRTFPRELLQTSTAPQPRATERLPISALDGIFPTQHVFDNSRFLDAWRYMSSCESPSSGHALTRSPAVGYKEDKEQCSRKAIPVPRCDNCLHTAQGHNIHFPTHNHMRASATRTNPCAQKSFTPQPAANGTVHATNGVHFIPHTRED